LRIIDQHGELLTTVPRASTGEISRFKACAKQATMPARAEATRPAPRRRRPHDRSDPERHRRCRLGDPVGYEAARSTFVSLLRRIHACVNAARWQVDDVTTAGEAVWSSVHGHTTLELTGFFGSVGRDPVRSYSEILTRLSIGLGDHALATARSLSTARRRAVRADRAEAASARRASP
jgi:Tetracyclin repressor-like, C-terminal domain